MNDKAHYICFGMSRMAELLFGCLVGNSHVPTDFRGYLVEIIICRGSLNITKIFIIESCTRLLRFDHICWVVGTC